MKLRLTDICLVIGLSLIFGPIYFDFINEINGFIIYFGFLLGTVLTSIAGYDALASMIGNGHPGEEILQAGLRKLKKFLKNIFID